MSGFRTVGCRCQFAFPTVSISLPSAVLGCLLACAPLSLATSTVAQEAVVSSLHGVATEELHRLREFEGTRRSRDSLLIRNLSRYFTRYVVPSNRDELTRFLGTVVRIGGAFGEGLYRQASQVADAAGAGSVARSHVEQVLEAWLPSRMSPWDEIVVFPALDPAGRVELEVADLAAYRDTGLSLETAQQLAEALAAAPEADVLPLEAEGAAMLIDGITLYGLAVLRLGGELAAADLAPAVQSRHLRQAERALRQRSAGEFVAPPLAAAGEDPEALLVDVTESAGIQFRHTTSQWLAMFRRYVSVAPTFSGGGISAADLDGDDWPDLVVCGGRGCATYRNRGDGTFEDSTVRSGINVDGEARMAIPADFDNDGDPDLFVTYARDTNRIFENDGAGTFSDRTQASGLERDGDVSGAAIAVDVDGDGLLDIFVANFGDYLAGATPDSPNAATNALPNRLYRNLGGLRFVEVEGAAGMADTGWAQAVSHNDLDLDGDQDIYIANDFGHNRLWLNRGDGTFEEVGAAAGADDRFHGMNVAFADLNRDRLPDIFITNIWFWDSVERATTETNTLLLSDGDLAGPVRFVPSEDSALRNHDSGWSWAALFFDLDHDADEDLYVANGFTPYSTFIQFRPRPDGSGELYPINNGGEANMLFLGSDAGFELLPGSGAELAGHNSRAVALLDFDRDGDLDLAVSTFHSEARLFRNDAPDPAAGWLLVELEGDPAAGGNRDAIGAQLVATGAGGLYLWRSVTGGEGYLARSDGVVHFGLGTAERVDLEVRWPGGSLQRIEGIRANQRIRVRQGVEGYETAGTS